MAEAKATKLGSSLSVPSVQELAKDKSLTQVPHRYVRPDLEPALLSASALPVIDMRKLVSEDTVDPELTKFDKACREWGFFQVINHGVKQSTVEKMKKEIKELFNLSTEEKKKLQEPGHLEGFGQHFVTSEEQKLEWADIFYLHTLPLHMRNSRMFSALSESFRDALDDYSSELRTLAMKILEKTAKALDINFNEVEENFKEGWQAIRINYYPPCLQPENVIGLNSHSDSGGLAIVLQLDETEGLQIKKDGNWLPVKPLPDAFVINIGNCLEIMTNGIYPSIEHRGAVNSSKERISVATFYSPKLDGKIGPAPSLVSPEHPPKFKTMIASDYFRGYYAAGELKGKSYLEEVKIQDEVEEIRN